MNVIDVILSLLYFLAACHRNNILNIKMTPIVVYGNKSHRMSEKMEFIRPDLPSRCSWHKETDEKSPHSKELMWVAYKDINQEYRTGFSFTSSSYVLSFVLIYRRVYRVS